MRYVLALTALVAVGACAEWFTNVDEANNPKDDTALSRCREEGRAMMHNTGDGDAAWNAYFACTQDAGLR